MSDTENINVENKVNDKTIKSIKTFTMIYNKQANDNRKKEYLNNNIKIIKNYVPYTMKMALVKNVVDATSFNKVKDKNGKLVKGNKYERNSAMEYILYIIMLIDTYTNITIEYGNDSYPITKQFDELNELKLIEVILNMIPEAERTEFKILMKMYKDDIYENNVYISSYLDKLVDRIGIISTTLLSPVMDKLMSSIENLDETQISSLISQYIKNNKDDKTPIE